MQPVFCALGGAEWAGGRGERSRGSAAGGTTGRRALRGPGAPAGGRGRTETPLQNSQRVLLAKPRTAAVSHRRRCGAAARVASRHGRIHRALPLRDTSMERGDGARDAKPHGVEHARGQGGEGAVPSCAPWRDATGDGDIASYRNGARTVRTRGARAGSVRRRRARPNREYTSGA